MHVVCSFSAPRCVMALLKGKPDLNVVDKVLTHSEACELELISIRLQVGRSPLAHAVHNQFFRLDLLRGLLAAGAHATETNHEVRSPLIDDSLNHHAGADHLGHG